MNADLNSGSTPEASTNQLRAIVHGQPERDAHITPHGIVVDGALLTDLDCERQRVRVTEATLESLARILDPADPMIGLVNHQLVNRTFQAWLEACDITGAWTWEGPQRDGAEVPLEVAHALDGLYPLLARMPRSRARLLGDLVAALVLGGAHLRAFVVAAGGVP